MTPRTLAPVVAAIVLAAAGFVRAEIVASPTTAPSTQPSASPTPAAVVGLSGEIDDFNRDSFIKRFNEAKAAGAKTVIVEIHTWGGLVTAGLDISAFLKRQSDVHTIAYVNHNAISAGAMIAMA